MGNSATSFIPGTKGEVFYCDDASGEEKKYHYHVVSTKKKKDVNTEEASEEHALIFYPATVKDIQAAIAYARQHAFAIALRSGGHHYPKGKIVIYIY
jgi:FAD/FMN-containing dehydrogenase